MGCGKTSIINMVTETLEERNKQVDEENQIIIVRFNPWNYSDRTQIIDQFFRQSIQNSRLGIHQKL